MEHYTDISDNDEEVPDEEGDADYSGEDYQFENEAPPSDLGEDHNKRSDESGGDPDPVDEDSVASTDDGHNEDFEDDDSEIGDSSSYCDEDQETEDYMEWGYVEREKKREGDVSSLPPALYIQMAGTGYLYTYTCL